MYSKARVAAHPMHPMLVGFPIAFYTATVATLPEFDPIDIALPSVPLHH